MSNEEFIFKEKQGKELDLFEQFITNYSKSQLAEMLCESLDNWNKFKEYLKDYNSLSHLFENDYNWEECMNKITNKMHELESGE